MPEVSDKIKNKFQSEFEKGNGGEFFNTGKKKFSDAGQLDSDDFRSFESAFNDVQSQFDTATKSPVTTDLNGNKSTGFTPLDGENSGKKEEEVFNTPVVDTPVVEETDLESKKRQRQEIRDMDVDFETKERLQRELSDRLRSGGEETPKINTPDTTEEEVIEKSQEQIFAEQNNIDFIKGSDGSFNFTPKTAEEALDIGMTFGTDKISTNSLNNKQAQAVIAKYGKYKNAPKGVYLQGLKSNEIGAGGPTWERLVKMNGGQPTAEMILAQEEYDKDLKIVNVNNTKNIVSGEDLETVNPLDDIAKLDEAYNKTALGLFGELSTNYAKFKSGNEKLSGLNASMTSTASRIDELNVAKRSVLDETKKRYPNLSLGQQLELARQDTRAIDDQLFVEQRQYNSDLSTYKFEETKAQGEFEYNAGLVEQKMKFVDSIYGTQRGDLIRKEEIDRQDKILTDSITRDTQAKKDAIAQGDIQAAKEFSYDLLLAEEKAKINDGFKKKFETLSLGDGSALITNNQTGEKEIVTKEGVTIDESTSTSTIVNNVSKIGSGAITGYGSPKWKWGLDIDGTKGQDLSTLIDGEVIFTGDEGKGFGNQVKIKDSNGNEIWYSHLDDINTEEGNTISGTDNIGTIGNTGTVIPGEGGDGSHVDITIKKSDGNFMTPQEVERYLNTPQEETPGFSEGRLARNAAIDLFIGGTELKKTTKQRTAASQELVDEFGVQIEDFRTENKGMVDIFNRVVAGATSKTSDKEQVMNFNKAIAESALGDGSTQPMKNKIRATLLDDSVISEKLETAKDTTEVIGVIQDLFDTVTKDTGVTTKGLETIARTIGKSTGDEITSIDQITGKMLAAYVKSISGAAVTDQEFERLATQMPSLKDNPERFQLMLTNFKDETVRANTVKARQLLNDDTLFGELFPELSKEKKKEETGSSFRNRGRNPEVTNKTTSSNLKFNINK